MEWGGVGWGGGGEWGGRGEWGGGEWGGGGRAEWGGGGGGLEETLAKCSHLNLTIPRLSLFLVALIFWSPGKHSLAALHLVTQRLQNKDNLHVMKGLNPGVISLVG